MRYFVYLDRRNSPHPNRPMKPFESLEKAWQKCPENYLIAVGSQEELYKYYQQPSRTVKKKGSE